MTDRTCVDMMPSIGREDVLTILETCKQSVNYWAFVGAHSVSATTVTVASFLVDPWVGYAALVSGTIGGIYRNTDAFDSNSVDPILYSGKNCPSVKIEFAAWSLSRQCRDKSCDILSSMTAGVKNGFTRNGAVFAGRAAASLALLGCFSLVEGIEALHRNCVVDPIRSRISQLSRNGWEQYRASPQFGQKYPRATRTIGTTIEVTERGIEWFLNRLLKGRDFIVDEIGTHRHGDIAVQVAQTVVTKRRLRNGANYG